MKKILHIAEPFASGVLRFLIDLTRLQVDKFEVYILWGERPLTPAHVEDLFDKRVRLIKLNFFRGALGSVLNPMAYVDVNRWYRKIRPDIVHLHSSASGFVGRWAIPCGRTRVFYTPHGYSFLSGNGSWLKRMLFLGAEKVSTCRKATTIACSKGEYEEAMRLTRRCTYISNGINLDPLRPYVRNLTSIDRPIKICTLGRIFAQKNPSLFNEIARLLPDARLTWIGDGELRRTLTADNIKITGWIGREEALKIVGGADFFLLTSLWEGLPIALLEAMYLKKICLVSNVIGNRDVIRSGENGIVCNGAEDYVEAIRRLADHPEEGIRLSENAHHDVESQYSIERMAKAYEEEYSPRHLSFV